MKKIAIILFFLFICTINTYSLEMSDLSVGDFSLIYEPTGNIFSYYDSPKRFFDIIGEERKIEKEEDEINDEFYYMWYRESKNLFARAYKDGSVSPTRLQVDGFVINEIKIYKDFRTIRGIEIGATLDEILENYNNCYVGNTNESNWGIFDESVELYSKEVIELNKEIDSAFLICEFKEYDRLLNIKTSDGIYYVIDFKLDDKKVSSIGFSVVPYLP